jgi:hypothetical protein
MQRGKPLKRSGRLAPTAVSRRTRLARTRLRARAPNGVKRMAHRRVPALKVWTKQQPCFAIGLIPGHVCGGFTDERPGIECAHAMKTRGAGASDLYVVLAMCPALHDATEAGKRHAWEAKTGIALAPLAVAHTERWLAETGFDLDAYLAGLDANPKRAAYAAELRDAMRESAVGAHLNPKEKAA